METERQEITIGARYGNARVVEELEARDPQGRRRFRCVCLVEREGAECGLHFVQTTKQLKSHAYRACSNCAAENTRRARRALVRWSRAGR